MIRFSRDVAYLWEFTYFKCPRTSNRKTCEYYLLHVVFSFHVYKMMMLYMWRIGIDKKGKKKNGVYFIDVKNTYECYMNFENVRISHTFVRYWYEIRDILVPILHTRWRIGTNYSRCEIYEVWNLRFNRAYRMGLCYIIILRWSVGLRWSGRNEGCDLRFVRAMSPKLGQ